MEIYICSGIVLIILLLQDQILFFEVLEQFYQVCKKFGDEVKNLFVGVFGLMMNDEFVDVIFVFFVLKVWGELLWQLVCDVEVLCQQLLYVFGVKKVNIFGEQVECIYFLFFYDCFVILGFLLEVIFVVLNSQNVLIVVGVIEIWGGQIFICFDGVFDCLQQICDMLIIVGGRMLKLVDVVMVEWGYEDFVIFLICYQGELVLLLGVVMCEGWNGLVLGKVLDVEMVSINQNLLFGMLLIKVIDQLVNISVVVDEFMIKFFVVLLVVMVVCFVSMGWCVGVVVVVVVFLIFVVVFVVMEVIGKNFDCIIFGLLIFVLGLLVDDVIIVIEMMVVKMEEGYDCFKVLVYVWSYIVVFMLVGILVMVVGFMFNGFVQFIVGEYVSNVFWIVGIVLIVFWMVVVIFIFWLGVYLLLDRKFVVVGYVVLYDILCYQCFCWLLIWVIVCKWCVVVGVVVLFIVVILGMSVVKKQFFFIFDCLEVLVEVQLFYGLLISQISVVVVKIEYWLQWQLEVKIVISYIGQGVLCFYLVMVLELFDFFFVKLVVLIDGQGVCEVFKWWLWEVVVNGLVLEVWVCVIQLVFGFYLFYLVVWWVMGFDLYVLFDIVEWVKLVLQVSLLMCIVNIDWGLWVLVMYFSFNQDWLQVSGFSFQFVVQQLQFLLLGILIIIVWEDICVVQVIGCVVGDICLDLVKIVDFILVGSGGQWVFLLQIGDVLIRMEDLLFCCCDCMLIIIVCGDVVENLQLLDVFIVLMKLLQFIIDLLLSGYCIEMVGLIEEFGKVIWVMVLLFLIMIVFMLLIIILQVCLLLVMVMVFLIVLLGLIGVVLMLLLFNQLFGINVLVGLIVLLGILMCNMLILIG